MGYTAIPQPQAIRVMMFIDGGYLRKGLQTLTGTDVFIPQRMGSEIVGLTPRDGFRLALIRYFYYDANHAPVDNFEEHKVKAEYFAALRAADKFELHFGDLVKEGKGGYRQKGVDVMLSVDLVQKAFMNQFDVAIIVAGDADFTAAVRAVKNTGKNVCGFFFEHNVAKQLKEELDYRRVITPEMAKRWVPEG